MRALLLCAGAAAGVAGVLLLAVLWPARPRPRPPLTAGCTRTFLIPVEWVCGRSVYFIHHGRREYAGRAADLAPMPRPPAKVQG